MRDGPAEIDLGVDDLAAAHRQYLGVAKARSRGAGALIGDEDAVAVLNQVLVFEAGDRLAVRPAAREIGLSVEAVVERAGEMEVVGNHCLDRRTVLVDIGLVRALGDGDGIVRHGSLLPKMRYEAKCAVYGAVPV